MSDNPRLEMGDKVALPLHPQGMQHRLELKLQSSNSALAELPMDLTTTNVGTYSNRSLENLHEKAIRTPTSHTDTGTDSLDMIVEKIVLSSQAPKRSCSWTG